MRRTFFITIIIFVNFLYSHTSFGCLDFDTTFYCSMNGASTVDANIEYPTVMINTGAYEGDTRSAKITLDPDNIDWNDLGLPLIKKYKNGSALFLRNDTTIEFNCPIQTATLLFPNETFHLKCRDHYYRGH